MGRIAAAIVVSFFALSCAPACPTPQPTPPWSEPDSTQDSAEHSLCMAARYSTFIVHGTVASWASEETLTITEPDFASSLPATRITFNADAVLKGSPPSPIPGWIRDSVTCDGQSAEGRFRDVHGAPVPAYSFFLARDTDKFLLGYGSYFTSDGVMLHNRGRFVTEGVLEQQLLDAVARYADATNCDVDDAGVGADGGVDAGP